MKYRVIACNMFQHEVETAARRSPHELSFTYFELGEHARPAALRNNLQQAIDETVDADGILLCYGLCGRATDGLTAGKVPVILPRSHDCGGILLGCRKRFETIFKPMPSTPFSSVGIIEHGEYFFSDGDLILGDGYDELIAKYGEDNAKYIYDAMHPRLDGELQPVYFISMPEVPSEAAREQCRARAARDGRPFRELDGDIRLIRMLLAGEHPDDEFLVVPPGMRIRQVGDWDRIVAAEPRHPTLRRGENNGNSADS